MRKTNQLQARLGLHKSKVKPTDFLCTSLIQDVLKDLPVEYDITDKMTPVQNQKNEGSCVGFSSTAIREAQEIIDYNLTPDTCIRFSERFIYEESKKISGHSSGSTLIACAQVLKKLGICEQKYWKYIPNEPGKPEEGAYINAGDFRISAYVRIKNEKELKASLIKYGAIHLGVVVTKTWQEVTEDGVIFKMNWWQRILFKAGVGKLGGHAIVLCGYSDRNKLYKFKNSWGLKFGQKGFGYIHYEDMKLILMDAFAYIDIDDERTYEELRKNIKTVKSLTRKERKNSWLK